MWGWEILKVGKYCGFQMVGFIDHFKAVMRTIRIGREESELFSV